MLDPRSSKEGDKSGTLPSLERGLRLVDPAGSADLFKHRPRVLDECPICDRIASELEPSVRQECLSSIRIELAGGLTKKGRLTTALVLGSRLARSS